MGLFSSLKKNFKHGGVKISMQAPESVSTQDASLPVTVTVTATDGPVQINSVKAEISAVSFNKNFNQPMGQTNMPENGVTQMPEVVARAENPQQFNLAPGQSQAVQLSITMGSGQPGGLTEKIESVAQLFNPSTYAYSLSASADVEGVALDPSTTKQLHIQGANNNSHITL
jgi:hypothetical protein